VGWAEPGLGRRPTAKNTGVRKMPNAVTPIIPANTAAPNSRRLSAPAPSGTSS
jgi:hypothetical protein